MQLPMQLIFGDLWDLDKLQTSAKGKSIFEFRFVSKEIHKMQKIATEQKSTTKWFGRAALWRVYVYLISSTSMQKENPVANSGRPIKIRCAKYKFAERSHNFLMQLPMQLIFGDLRSWQASNLCQRKINFGFPFRVKGKSKKCKKLQQSKKVPKNGLTEPPFREYMFIWLVRHPCKRKIQ